MMTTAEAKDVALAATYKILEHNGAPGLLRTKENPEIVAKRLATFIKTLAAELQK